MRPTTRVAAIPGGLRMVEVDTNVWVNADDVRAIEWSSAGGRPSPEILFKQGGRVRALKYSVRTEASAHEKQVATDALVGALTGTRVSRT